MVESTDLRNLDDPFLLVRLNCPTFWCVLIQGQVRAGFVIVAEIIFERSAQMIVVEDDHMIQALATDASNHPLHVAKGSVVQCKFPRCSFLRLLI